MRLSVLACVGALGAMVALGACDAGSGSKKNKNPSKSAVECAPLEPEVLLVLEGSERMRQPMPGQTKGTRWSWLVSALKQKLPHVKNDADLALLVFPAVSDSTLVSSGGQATAISDGKADSAKPSDDESGKSDGKSGKTQSKKQTKTTKSKPASSGKSTCTKNKAKPAVSNASPGPVAVVGGPVVVESARAAECFASPPQVPFGSPYGKIVSTLEHVQPTGAAPVAAALRAAANTFAAREPSGRSRHVLLVVDGDDSCTGDALAEIQALRALGVDVWIATFADVDQGALGAWAIAGGHPTGGLQARVLKSESDLDALGAAILLASSQEVCDGLDNDCDGKVDEGLSRTCLASCGGGEQLCVAGTWRACGMTSQSDPPEEVCDGTDNDCDGEVDEGFGVGEHCVEETGPCSFGGVLACSDGGMSTWCDTGDPWPGPEVCDGLDNNCDGLVDEDSDASCTDGCHQGVRSCVDGALGECVLGETFPELCDGLDNDCDGEVDEDYDLGATCVTADGDCIAQGVMICADDGLSAFCGDTTPTSPMPEACNGIDDDCDGVVDNDVDLCPGTQICYGGQCIWD